MKKKEKEGEEKEEEEEDGATCVKCGFLLPKMCFINHLLTSGSNYEDQLSQGGPRERRLRLRAIMYKKEKRKESERVCVS